MTLGTFNPLRNLVIITKEKTELHLNEQLNNYAQGDVTKLSS